MSDGYENRPYSDRELVPTMEKLYRRLEVESDSLKALGQARAQARDDYNKAHAHALLLCKSEHPEMSSADLRAAWVINQTQVGDLMLAKDLAETIYDDHRETIRSLRSNVELIRSMAASVRDASS